MALLTDRLKSLLQEDLKDLTKLEQLLNQERSALVERATDSLKQLTSEKSSCIKTIEYRAKEKAKLFVDAGYAIKTGEFEKAVLAIEDSELHTLWYEVNTMLRQCKDQNTVNETVVSHSLKRVNKLMNIIRGQGSKPNLYGSSGREHSLSGMNSIAKA